MVATTATPTDFLPEVPSVGQMFRKAGTSIGDRLGLAHEAPNGEAALDPLALERNKGMGDRVIEAMIALGNDVLRFAYAGRLMTATSTLVDEDPDLKRVHEGVAREAPLLGERFALFSDLSVPRPALRRQQSLALTGGGGDGGE